MKEIGSSTYQFLPKIFLRAPYYSFAGYDLSRLPEVLEEMDFRNAVFLASPEFYALLEKKAFEFDKLAEREKHTLYKYYNRMCFRPTPFGSFASFTLLGWGNGEQVRLSGREGSSLHLLPDQQLLHQLHNETHYDGEAELVVNPTLYRFNDVFRYTKSSVNEKGKFSFSLEGIAAARFNIQLFSFLTSKRPAGDQLAQWIMKRGECSSNEAQEYIQFLLDAGAVFSEVQGNVISDEVIGDFHDLPGWKAFWNDYARISLSAQTRLAEAARKINSIVNGKASAIRQPFYAALERPVITGGPDRVQQDDLSSAVHVLRLLSNAEQPKDLAKFIRDFRSRFDQQKVPLLTALDPDAGLDYGDMEPSMPGQHILENIPFPESGEENKTLGWYAAQQFIFRLWIGDTLRNPWSPLQITDEHVNELESQKRNTIPMPQTQALLYRSTGEHLIIESSGGVTGAALIGRFSCFSREVHEFCQQLAAIEGAANPEVAFADIAQQSDTHVDNINRRKSIYAYQIPLNVFTGKSGGKLIAPSDLVLSLRGDELILESSTLQKRVIPRLATAYNFRNNHLPVFRLLCDLQFQGIHAGLSFSLESFFPGLPFYPRVCHGRVILSLAKWNFKGADLEALKAKESFDGLRALERFRKKHNIPRHITVGADDQQLVFDLGNTSEAKFFIESVTGRKTLTIQEYLLPDRSVLSGKKPVAGQMIAFFSHENQIYSTSKNEVESSYDKKSRSFLLGSNWLYLKIFCIPRASDEILIKVIFPFIKSQKRRIQKWFFIRYSENGYHIRLRLQAAEDDLGPLVVSLKERIESTGYDKLIRDFQGDTYRREIERYGQDLMPHVEELFCKGSHLAVLALALRAKNQLQPNEFELALITAYGMVKCFFSSPADSLNFVSKVADQFMLEFRADKLLRLAMDEKYRELKIRIADLIDGDKLSKVMQNFLKEMSSLNVLTQECSQEKRLALMSDLIHMQLNRTFSVRQRQQELLVYYCLQKYMSSVLARQKSLS